MMAYDYPHPVSRTYQYKKITKPLLERKRRARINRCLDELKDLMVDALETEGENISKLEKADILELTVRHLQRLQAARSSASSQTSNDDVAAESRWQSGFGHCAAEACKFLSALPGEAAERLARHLASGLQTNRRPNQMSTPNLLSPTLSSLERTASMVTTCPSKSTTNSPTTFPRKVSSPSTPYPKINLEKSHENLQTTISPSPRANQLTSNDNDETKTSAKEPTTENKACGSSQHADDEEEIDVERVDNTDPMWRPW